MRLDGEHTLIVVLAQDGQQRAPVDHIHTGGRVVDVAAVDVQRALEMYMVEIRAVERGLGQIIAPAVDRVGRVELDAQRFEVVVDDVPLMRLVDVVVPRAVVDAELHAAGRIVDERLKVGDGGADVLIIAQPVDIVAAGDIHRAAQLGAHIDQVELVLLLLGANRAVRRDAVAAPAADGAQLHAGFGKGLADLRAVEVGNVVRVDVKFRVIQPQRLDPLDARGVMGGGNHSEFHIKISFNLFVS